MKNFILRGLLTMPLLVSPAIPLGGTWSYDPLTLAVEALTLEGMPPPQGWTIREAGSGELGRVPAKVDHEEQTILVDVARALDALKANGSTDPGALVAYLKMLLWHEYHHTDAYDLPHPDDPDLPHPDAPSRYSDPCGHFDLGGASLDYLCGQICSEEDPVVKAALCETHDAMTESYNGKLLARNKMCSPALNRKFLCSCCDSEE